MPTRIRPVLLALLLLAFLAPASLALAQDDAAPPAPVAELLRDLRNLQQSLVNGGGVKERDLPLLRDFRSRIEGLREQFPDNKSVLAADTQVAVWLKDDDGVDAGYGRLLDLAGDDEALASRIIESWAGYHARQRNQDRIRTLYEDLLAKRPDDVAVKKNYAQWLRQSGEFERAYEVLEPLELDPATDVRALLTRAEAAVALHRFQEAYDTLESIPSSATESQPAIAARITQIRDAAATYIELWTKEQEIRSREAAADDLPRAEIETAKGTITIELFEDQAPNTVANFISLAEKAYYHNSGFYAVIASAYVMGGDPAVGTDVAPGRSNPGYRIPDESGREDARKNFTGSIGMVKGSQPDSAGSLFYIALRPLPERNGGYTVFGRVIEGMDVVRKLEKDDIIRSVTITRKRDHEYAPETLPLS